MGGLVLKLSPRERILINGAVVENGDRRSRLNIVTPNANILRLRDAIHPHEVNTPVRRVCYIAQLALSGDANLDEAAEQIKRGANQLRAVLSDTESGAHIDAALEAAGEKQFYRVLKSLRGLLPYEERLIFRSRQ